jgi:hypothetical protein
MPTEDRGRLLVGTRALARHVFGDERRWRSMYGDGIKRELGLFLLGQRMAGYTGVIDARLADKVNAALAEPPRRQRDPAAATPT